jgi:hypothetical protein
MVALALAVVLAGNVVSHAASRMILMEYSRAGMVLQLKV